MLKQKKHINLIAYEINYNVKNLFDDEYTGKRNPGDVMNEIARLKQENDTNFIKLGRNLLELLDGHLVGEVFYSYLRHEQVKLKRTQALKYIEVYNYCNRKFRQNQLTEATLKLGIEKLYLLSRLENMEQAEQLEQFILDKNLSVKKLAKVVEILNNKNEELNLVNEFQQKYLLQGGAIF